MINYYTTYKLNLLLSKFLTLGCFSAIYDKFKRDEVETAAQATEKRQKPEKKNKYKNNNNKKLPVRSKDIRSMFVKMFTSLIFECRI